MRKIADSEYQERESQDIQERKSTKTAFILMFPCLIIAIMGTIWSPLYAAIITMMLAIYQFLMLKQFIEDYYRK